MSVLNKIPTWVIVLTGAVAVAGGAAFIIHRRKQRLKTAASAAAAATANLAAAAAGDKTKLAGQTLQMGIPTVIGTATPDGNVIVQTATGNAVVGTVTTPPAQTIPVTLTADGSVVAAVPDATTGTLVTGVVGTHSLPPAVIAPAATTGGVAAGAPASMATAPGSF